MKKLWAVIVAGLAVAWGMVLPGARDAGATPLIAMQAASKCDSCHVMPDRSDPKWVEGNYALAARRCRATCGACHVNPTGGMLRSEAGQNYGAKGLPMNAGAAAPLEKGLSLLKENPLLTFGGDFRFMGILATGEEDKKSPYFFPMQADVYLGSRLGEHVALLTQFGLQRGGNSEVREVFGLVDRLPYNGYVKFGKFMPPFGHRLEDHTVYVRKELLVDQSNPVSYNSGVEVGVEPLVLYGRLAYFNEDLSPAGKTEGTPTVVSGVVGWQGLWLQLGASYLNVRDNQNWGFATNLPGTARGERTAYGGYGSVTWRNLTWLFEADLVTNEVQDRGDFEELVTYNELDYLVTRGITLKARFETLDPNRDTAEDALFRYTGGIELHPFPFTEVDLQYRYHDPEAGKEYGQVLLLAHLWY